MTPLELLHAGKIDEFNARRGQRGTVDLFAADLANLPLKGVDFSRANLEKADLSGSDLTGANLAQANLSGADLTGATLDRVVAVKAKFKEAYLGEARADGGEFTGADFAEADLTGLHAPKARFVNARFRSAILTNALFAGGDLSEAKLSEADLRGADLSHVNLTSADLTKANCGGARFEKANLHGARLAGASLRSCYCAGASFVEADLTSVDLTGSVLEGADLSRADLFEVQADEGALQSAKQTDVPEAVSADPDILIELHFEDPSVVVSGGVCAVLWENPDGEDVMTQRAMVCALGGTVSGVGISLPVPAAQVTARALLPAADGFTCVFFVEKPGGVELVTLPLSSAGVPGEARSMRLGYAPAVRPVLTTDGDALHVFGIGRQGVLSVHRVDSAGITELVRAPATTWRGFCGRADPILLGKGGTLATVKTDGIGKLLTAPTGYPGRLTSAAWRAADDTVGVAWSVREEHGLRFSTVAKDAEAHRLDAKLDIGALDLAAYGDRWLVVWTRDGDTVEPVGAWMPGGKPFPLLKKGLLDEVEDVRLVHAGGRPLVAVTGFGGEMIVVEVGESATTIVAQFGV